MKIETTPDRVKGGGGRSTTPRAVRRSTRVIRRAVSHEPVAGHGLRATRSPRRGTCFSTRRPRPEDTETCPARADTDTGTDAARPVRLRAGERQGFAFDTP
ncbi:hypothetical protein MINT15_02720 [Saccharomonospora viridis]|uniref:Uncharacterized protein n=1 Tax=Saccharomonospora viridis TaxID=1852 RepID=A0A837DHN8_9PSEU|nr:hypothetical protein MINT15_02720 [Saccharomonospora viridis]